MPMYEVRLESFLPVRATVVVEAFSEDNAEDIADYDTDLDSLSWTVPEGALPNLDFVTVVDISLVETGADLD